MAIYHHGTLIVPNGNVQTDHGIGVAKPATGFPAMETSLLPFTTYPVHFAPGVVYIYNAFGDPDEGIVFVNNFIQTSEYPVENPAVVLGLPPIKNVIGSIALIALLYMSG